MDRIEVKTDDGGPAFPRVGEGFGDPHSPGMTLRDWFAGHTAASIAGGILARGSKLQAGDAKHLAGNAYALADAMLAERAKAGA